MRLLTIIALATVAAGLYQFQKSRTRLPRDEQAAADEYLAEQVRAGIGGAAARVDVSVIHGIVALHGTVRTRAERDLVLAAALAVPGVTQVTNLLETDEPIGEIGTMQSGIATGD